LTRVQLVECALQLFKLLPGLAELAFRRQALVVGNVFGGFRDERVEIRCGLGDAGTAAALIDETASPKRAATADSKVALYRHALPTFTYLFPHAHVLSPVRVTAFGGKSRIQGREGGVKDLGLVSLRHCEKLSKWRRGRDSKIRADSKELAG
jgi:hypothetical protein